MKQKSTAYTESQYPSKEERKSLVDELKLSDSQVDQWFTHKCDQEGTTKHGTFTLEQTKALQKAYTESGYPSKEKRKSLVDKLKLSKSQIDQWFKCKHNQEGITTSGPFILEQTKALQKAYTKSQYPSKEKRKSLVDELKLSKSQVDKWFTHKCASSKKAATPGTSPIPNPAKLLAIPGPSAAPLLASIPGPSSASTAASTSNCHELVLLLSLSSLFPLPWF
ncbi:hypothetical protein VKT23_005583 [Stygiomarasmius scandens]|uniref:Homeobox domain-containing protein n=1 Tax=Marasmiellus scandens TaxID=2682957 RepID=A0ABR1JRE4_9AGAR